MVVLTFFEILKANLINVIAILMMSAKLAIQGPLVNIIATSRCALKGYKVRNHEVPEVI